MGLGEMLMIRGAFAGTALLVLGASPALAEQCVATIPTITMCKRCRVALSAATTAGTSCFGAPPPPQMGKRALLESKVVSQPKNGRVSLSGATWHYTPKPGFSGRDTFTIERDYLESEQLYVIFLDVSMDVRAR